MAPRYPLRRPRGSPGAPPPGMVRRPRKEWTVPTPDLAHHLLPVVEAAAIASARSMGQGDRKHSDRLAVEAMHKSLQDVPFRGRVVIGEGERDEAPMLWIGEEVGRGRKDDPRVDIAVDPLEGTNL